MLIFAAVYFFNPERWEVGITGEEKRFSDWLRDFKDYITPLKNGLKPADFSDELKEKRVAKSEKPAAFLAKPGSGFITCLFQGLKYPARIFKFQPVIEILKASVKVC